MCSSQSNTPNNQSLNTTDSKDCSFSLGGNRQQSNREKSTLKKRWGAIATSCLLAAPTVLFALPKSAIAQAPPGTIENTATGSFVDTSTGDTEEIFSNTVTVTVIEVAGIGITPQTPIEATFAEATALLGAGNEGDYQGFDGVNTGDLVFFDFVIENLGNDPTSFFIPDTPSTLTGATFTESTAPIQIIAVDPDGASGGTAPTTLSVDVTTPENTINLLGSTDGYIPPGGTVTVRVPVIVTETTIGNSINVVLGNTGANDNSAGTQNEDSPTAPAGNDATTVDLADGTVTPTQAGYTGTTPEANNPPAVEKEASALGSVNLAAAYQLKGYKSVAMTTDANSEGTVNEGDTLTWTVYYVNTGTGNITNLQITDSIATGDVTYTASSLTVRTGNTTVGIDAGTALASGDPTANASYDGNTNTSFFTSPVILEPNEIIRIDFQTSIDSGGTVPRIEDNQASANGDENGGAAIDPVLTDNVDNSPLETLPNGVVIPPGSIDQTENTSTIAPTTLEIVTPSGSPITNNPPLNPNFCLPSADLLFILDESGSVDNAEKIQQRNGVRVVLQYLIDNGITGNVAIVSFAGNDGSNPFNTAPNALERLDYTEITPANLNGSINDALNAYGTIPGSAPQKLTNWEAAFNTAQTLQIASSVSPDTVFFFTDGRANLSVNDDPDQDSPVNNVTEAIDEANYFKQQGIHIYGVNIDPLSTGAASFADFENILDGDQTLEFTVDGSSNNPVTTNAREADYLEITNYASLVDEFSAQFRQICGLKDYGDAPDTTNGSATGDYQTTALHGGPAHIVFDDLKLGTARTDYDSGTLQNPTATADDDGNNANNQTTPDDEDGVSSFPTLRITDTDYSLTVNVVNNTGADAYLVGWIDLNRNGVFESGEGVRQIVSNGASSATLNWSGLSGLSQGTSYARFRLSNSIELDTTRPNGTGTTTGIFADGEVEDYLLTIEGASSGTPDLLLVKRITKLTPGDGGASTIYPDFVDDGRDGNTDGTIDNFDPGWPGYVMGGDGSNTFTLGRINLEASPGDTVEYTIYFLNTGDANASNVEICDALKPFLTFNPSSTIELSFDGTSTFLTSISGDDQGEFVAANTVSGCREDNGAGGLQPLANLNGTVKVNLGNDVVTSSAGPGTPSTSFGYIRFETSVD